MTGEVMPSDILVAKNSRPVESSVLDFDKLQAGINAYFTIMASRPYVYAPGKVPNSNLDVDLEIDGKFARGFVFDVCRDLHSDWLDNAVVTLGMHTVGDLEPGPVVTGQYVYTEYRLTTLIWLYGARITGATSLGAIFQ